MFDSTSSRPFSSRALVHPAELNCHIANSFHYDSTNAEAYLGTVPPIRYRCESLSCTCAVFGRLRSYKSLKIPSSFLSYPHHSTSQNSQLRDLSWHLIHLPSTTQRDCLGTTILHHLQIPTRVYWHHTSPPSTTKRDCLGTASLYHH
jgi:hypothetical protein